jgi:hypothetical protein
LACCCLRITPKHDNTLLPTLTVSWSSPAKQRKSFAFYMLLTVLSVSSISSVSFVSFKCCVRGSPSLVLLCCNTVLLPGTFVYPRLCALGSKGQSWICSSVGIRQHWEAFGWCVVKWPEGG